MFVPHLLSCIVLIGVVVSQQISLNVGMLIPKDDALIDSSLTYNTSAGAVTFALQRARELKVWDPSLINITFSWYFNQCDESLSAGYTSRLIYQNDVSAIMGPVCPETSFVTGAITSFKKIPTFLWGPAAPADFYTREKYTTTMPFAGTARGMFVALSNIMAQFNWTECAFLYTTSNDINGVCRYFADSFTILSNQTRDINPVYIRQIIDTSPKGFHNSFEVLKSRIRIIISCLESPRDKRNYMLAALDANIATNDFIHLFTQITSTGFGSPPFWVGNDGRDIEVRDATARSVVLMDKSLNVSQARISLLQDIADNIFDWPFYCKNCQKNGTASSLAIYLGDAMLAYLIALNATYTKYGINQLRNTSAIMEYFSVTRPEMPSITGSTYILTGGIRSARYNLITMNSTYQGRVWAIVQSAPNSAIPYTPDYENENTTVWALQGGIRPVDIPKCGFSNEKCPQSPIFYTIIVVGSIICFFLVVCLLGVAIFLFQNQQRRRLNALWQIPFFCLRTMEQRDNSKSLRSTHTIMSNNTNSSRSSNIVPRRNNTDRTGFFYYNQAIVMARHYPHTSKWTDAEEDEFRRMRMLDHENLNRFLGVAISGNTCYMIWSYNERGSLMEVIKQHAFRVDNFIMVGMIRNIVEGIHYIHNSPFMQHGALSVYRCVVGDRFEVKIQCYGLHGIKQRTFRTLNENIALFAAPEHLHGQQNIIGSQPGDIYSLGIICSVILTLKPAYNCDEDDDKQAAEIVRSIARGKYPPVRPELEIAPEIEINHELLTLIKKMWSEHPPERPTIENIREAMVKRISTSKKSNLMDYMFGLMEGTAAELEQDVQQRTMELLEEQKKADILLYRMMPREAADNLKLGQTVAPEVYESATVFFSDIVSFTVLASKSTPLQIISFLNDAYSLADAVIEKFDVYKVETIGDGMHVVSGVPKRNGNNHVKEIADMAIDFQRAVKTLRMSHLPDHQIQMRVGLHSGAAVAGIVGLTSPRYIVFGDTVNVAAKMEASGRAGRIHISGSTKSLLQTHFPNRYTVVDRGETLIKGIGPMHTAWIVPPEEILNFQP